MANQHERGDSRSSRYERSASGLSNYDHNARRRQRQTGRMSGFKTARTNDNFNGISLDKEPARKSVYLIVEQKILMCQAHSIYGDPHQRRGSGLPLHHSILPRCKLKRIMPTESFRSATTTGILPRLTGTSSQMRLPAPQLCAAILVRSGVINKSHQFQLASMPRTTAMGHSLHIRNAPHLKILG